MNTHTKAIIYFLLLSLTILSQGYGSWISIDSLNIRRDGHAATVMPNGDVLVVGGLNSDSILASCEIYSVEINDWQLTTPMINSRSDAGLVTLNNGSVLVIGGRRTQKCEIFDPLIMNWSVTDSLKIERQYIYPNMVAKLDNGRILVTGGTQLFPKITQLANCEVFNPIQEKWIEFDSLNFRRWGHTTTVLKNGQVLVVGGSNDGKDLNICEIYDPTMGEWEIVDSLNIARSFHSALLLDDGKILVTGGQNYDNPISPWLTSCEVYDPEINNWTLICNTEAAFSGHDSFLIDEHTVLLVGREDYYEILDLNTNSSLYYEKYPVRKAHAVFKQLPNKKIIGIAGTVIYGDTTPIINETKKCEIFERITTVPQNKYNNLDDFLLYQNYPNPFNPFTTIEYELNKTSKINITVYDTLGRKIKELYNGIQSAGKHKTVFNASGQSSGVYLVALNTSSGFSVKKTTYLK